MATRSSSPRKPAARKSGARVKAAARAGGKPVPGKKRAKPRRARAEKQSVLLLPPVRTAYPGGCHCGAIEYSYETSLPPRRWPVRLCDCSFCRGHGVRSTSDPEGELSFRFERPEYLRRYRFALRTADFLICKECGTYVASVLLSGRGAHAVINLNTLREVPAGIRPGKAVSRKGETIEERRSRRILSWTPVSGPV